MSIPVVQRIPKCLFQLSSCFKAPSLQGQRLQLLPPGLNQIEPAGILRDELKLYLWPSQKSHCDLSGCMGGEVVFNDEPVVRRKLENHLFQQQNMTPAIPTVACYDRGLSCSRFKGPVDPKLPASPIIRLKGGTNRLWNPLLSRIGLGCQGSQFIDTDDTRSGPRRNISIDYGPLFSTNSGSWRSGS